MYKDASLGLKARLQWLSNAAIRYIFGIGGMTRISPFQSKLDWLRIDSRMRYSALLTMYKVIRMNVPEWPTRGVRTDLEIPKVKKRGLSSFSVVGARLWTSFSPGIRDLPSYS